MIVIAVLSFELLVKMLLTLKEYRFYNKTDNSKNNHKLHTTVLVMRRLYQIIAWMLPWR